MEIFNNLNYVVKPLLVVWLVSMLQISHADKDDSSSSLEIHQVPTCNRMAVPGFPNFYTEMFGFFWDTLQCPGELVFNPVYCECIFPFNMPSILPLNNMAPATVDIPMLPAIPQEAPPQLQLPTPQPFIPVPLPQTLAPSPPPTTTTTTTEAAPIPVRKILLFFETPKPRPPPTFPKPTPKRTTTTTTTTTTVPTTRVVTFAPTETTTATTIMRTVKPSTPKPTTTEKPEGRGIVRFLFSFDKLIPRRTKAPTTTPVALIRNSVVREEEVVVESGSLSIKSICSGCRFDGGVGYKSHERDCDKYVMCSPSGVQGSMKADVRGCGVGEYWDQSLLTCRLSTDVPCPADKCRAMGNWYTYNYHGDCRAYWKCENGVSIGHCCPRGQGYVEGVGCLRNPSCKSNCGLPVIEIGCIKKAVPGNPRKFRQTIEGHGVIDMDCAGGTVFNPDTCDCQTDQTVVYKSQACTKELDISFTPEVKDVSGKNIHVNGINITYSNGAVCFHGDGAVVVPRFANAEIGKTLEIKLRFKSSDRLIGNDLQAVVYNGDCGMDPSIVVAIAKDKIVYTLRNKSNRTRTISLNMPIKIDKWISGSFSLRNDMMTMTIDGRTEKKLFFGDIDRSRCGLKLGWGKQYESFVGCIDKMSVSFCQDNTT